MKRFLLSGFVVVTFIGYALHQRLDSEAAAVVPPTIPTSTPAPPPPAVTSGATPPPQASGQYKNGTYTGSVADAFYGNVQVKAVISGGRITDVQFLQYPNDRQTSVEINTQAMPYLTQEAMTAQSAQVDGVTGATQTSRAFIESLQSALDQAK